MRSGIKSVNIPRAPTPKPAAPIYLQAQIFVKLKKNLNYYYPISHMSYQTIILSHVCLLGEFLLNLFKKKSVVKIILSI